MGQQRREECQPGKQGSPPGYSWRPVRMPAGIDSVPQAVDDQAENNNDADIQSDLNTEQGKQRQAMATVFFISQGRVIRALFVHIHYQAVRLFVDRNMIAAGNC